jgi:hypothetical protein
VRSPAPQVEKLCPSLDRIEGPHPLRQRLGMGDEPFWTKVGIPPKTRMWFKTRRTGRARGGPAPVENEQP